MSFFFSNYSPRGVAASMSRVFGAREGANQTARDGEEWPLSWELRSHAAPFFYWSGPRCISSGAAMDLPVLYFHRQRDTDGLECRGRRTRGRMI